MTVHFNTMVKNEAILLNKILPIWKKYPVDLFVFYDDTSSDNTKEVIANHLSADRYVILNDKLPHFNESHYRSKMLEYSRSIGAEFVLAIDADELLSANLAKDLLDILPSYNKQDTFLFWYNVVNDSLAQTRNDPMYHSNYRSFILPLSYTGNLDLSLWKYHTPRVPHVNLPKSTTKKYGIIHLQALNRRFYSLKQLWYKHYELVNYGHTVDDINRRYDPVVNNLDFMSLTTPAEILGNLEFDSRIFDEIESVKRYRSFILENYNPNLITFGHEYLENSL